MVFLKIVCTNELEVLLGPKVASLSVRGKNNKIMNPAPVAMMHFGNTLVIGCYHV
jgi:hypothetical protein